MEGKILIYGPTKTGKSEFIRRINGVETPHTEYSNMNIKPYPIIYVTNEKPDDTILFDIVLRFEPNREVVFEKGFKLDSVNAINEHL